MPIYSIIKSAGSFVPGQIIPNKHFLENKFYNADGRQIELDNQVIVDKFYKITGIKSRRYARMDMRTSDLATAAAEDALSTGKIDPESLDYIVVAHNFADVNKAHRRMEMVPAIASRVKHNLGIDNTNTVPYDLIFGCPGWLQGIIQADYFIRSGDAKRVLVIGADMLSRVSDPHDRDSMIYADGAGATVLESIENEEPVGILAHSNLSDTKEMAYTIRMDRSNDPGFEGSDLFLKMNGRKLYEFALKNVPQLLEQCLKKANIFIEDIKKVLIHQANFKMDEAIVHRLFKRLGVEDSISKVMPMTISWLGNSSVATLPTLFDYIAKGNLPGHLFNSGDHLLFASLGAGLNVNALVYRCP